MVQSRPNFKKMNIKKRRTFSYTRESKYYSKKIILCEKIKNRDFLIDYDQYVLFDSLEKKLEQNLIKIVKAVWRIS